MLEQTRERDTTQALSLASVLTLERVCVLDTNRKREALDALIETLGRAPQVTDAKALADAVFERESLMSTGIGLGMAVPHVRLASVKDVVMAAAVSRQNIEDYDSLDGKPVRVLFMIAARPDQHAAYLRLLSLVSLRLRDETVRARLTDARDPAGFYAAMVEE